MNVGDGVLKEELQDSNGCVWWWEVGDYQYGEVVRFGEEGSGFLVEEIILGDELRELFGIGFREVF